MVNLNCTVTDLFIKSTWHASGLARIVRHCNEGGGGVYKACQEDKINVSGGSIVHCKSNIFAVALIHNQYHR